MPKTTPPAPRATKEYALPLPYDLPTVRVELDRRAQLEQACAERDTPRAQMLRWLIDDLVEGRWCPKCKRPKCVCLRR